MAQVNEEVREAVELGGAERVRAVVKMGVGRLRISGGAEALMEGRFEYSVPEWRPKVTYEVTDGEGLLVVEQPITTGVFSPSPKYVWDLAFSNQVPLTLVLRLGSGDATLEMGGTRLAEVEAAVGSGSLYADLSKASEVSAVSLNNGSGRLGLITSGEYEALREITMRTASGISEVALGGAHPVLERVAINSASGKIDLGITGSCPKLETLTVNTASGLIDLSVGIELSDRLDVALHCVSGKATVTFPPEVGVALRFSSVTGRLDAADFHRADGRYVNKAFDAAKPHLRLNVSTVSGALVVQPANA
ncbi:MAG: toast rack family protein [Anaerolineae bacterium]